METLFTYPPLFQRGGLLLGLVLVAYAAFAWRRSGRFGQHRWAAAAFMAIFLVYSRC